MAPAVVVALAKRSGLSEPLVVDRASEISGSVWTDTLVREDRFLHIRGNHTGALTIESRCERRYRRFH